MAMRQAILSGIRQLEKHPRVMDWVGGKTKAGNPFSEERARYPYPIFEQTRQQGPVVWLPLYQEWAVTGYDECLEALRNPDLGNRPSGEMLFSFTPYNKLSPTAQSFVTNWIVFLDGQAHSHVRGLVNRAFTPRQIVRLEPRIVEVADRLVSELGPGEPDVFTSFTSLLPGYVMGELLGIPERRWDWLVDITKVLGQLLDPIRPFDAVEMETAIMELRGYLLGLADIRRESPTGDMISALVEANGEDQVISTDELVSLVGALIFAGNETTTGLLGNAIVAMTRYPDQRQMLLNDPALWPNAIEEFLRYDPPIVFDPRTALRDTTIAGHSVKQGQMVSLILAAANRDPRQHDTPGALRLDRQAPRPISFGHGVHHCVGAALARAEARIGLQAFLREFGHYEIDLDAVEWRRSSSLRGPISLPVRRGPVEQ